MSGKIEIEADKLSDEIYGLCCDIGRLEVENAKLHDAVHVLVYCGSHVDCDGCLLNDNPYDTHAVVEWFACDALREMIDELGVEVNDEGKADSRQAPCPCRAPGGSQEEEAVSGDSRRDRSRA